MAEYSFKTNIGLNGKIRVTEHCDIGMHSKITELDNLQSLPFLRISFGRLGAIQVQMFFGVTDHRTKHKGESVQILDFARVQWKWQNKLVWKQVGANKVRFTM